MTADQKITHRVSIDLAKNWDSCGARYLFSSCVTTRAIPGLGPLAHRKGARRTERNEGYTQQSRDAAVWNPPTLPWAKERPFGQATLPYLAEESDDPTQVTDVRDSRTVTVVLREQIFYTSRRRAILWL